MMHWILIISRQCTNERAFFHCILTRFTVSETIQNHVSERRSERFFKLRFSSFHAHHDDNKSPFTDDARSAIGLRCSLMVATNWLNDASKISIWIKILNLVYGMTATVL